MARYRHKPVEVEARQWRPDDPRAADDVATWLQNNNADFTVTGVEDNAILRLPTPEGVTAASPGDWVIRGVSGEFHPCKDSTFHQTYELVES